jgi:hypothetical protein
MAKMSEGRATATQGPIFSNGSSDENYMISDRSRSDATHILGGQPFGAPADIGDR